MFYVTNKDKIISVAIALSTVLILFLLATTFKGENLKSIQTSVRNSNKLLPIYNVDTEDSKIALTINCAWNADDIDLILKTLNEQNVKATFFLVGDWIDKFPDAVKKINDSGNEIANHSNTHPHVNNLDLQKNIDEIQDCSNKIKAITGKGTNLYRGPYGEYNNTVITAANNSEHIPIQWNIDTLDYTGLTGEQMWERIKNKLKNGSIILMHNGTENTALSLDMIVKNIKEKGFKLVTVSELIYKDNYSIDTNGMQHKM